MSDGQPQTQTAVTGGKKRTERLQVMLEPEELEAIDIWKFENRLPTRAAAIRELLRRGLLAQEPKISAEAGRGNTRNFGVLRRQ
ncbi:hypothetical protein GH722_16735 [Alphaproteobacteria bacterium HT1-32]|nr:hypothetical protein [Alphaproteobacteria bacterium HT1-32]